MALIGRAKRTLLLSLAVGASIKVANAWTLGECSRTRNRSACNAAGIPIRLSTRQLAMKSDASAIDRRDALRRTASASIAAALAGFGGAFPPQPALAYTPDSDKLRESLYLMSRVQESTVQLERLIKNSKTQDELKPKLKLKLKLVQASYRLQDQINNASQFVDPPDGLVAATEAGNIAVSSLQDAVVFVRDELPGTGPITTEQREFLNESLQNTRDALFTFLDYMPKEKLEAARKRVEVENVDNREEFDDDLAYDKSAGIYNPVKLPWKQ